MFSSLLTAVGVGLLAAYRLNVECLRGWNALCDITEWWRLTSPGSGLCRQRAMDCDLTSLAAYPRAPAEPGPA